MCQAKRRNMSRHCGVCLKLKNLLRIHYKQFHTKYTVDISLTAKTRGCVKLSDIGKGYETMHSIKREAGYEQLQFNEWQSSFSDTALQSQLNNYIEMQPIKTENLSDVSDFQNDLDDWGEEAGATSSTGACAQWSTSLIDSVTNVDNTTDLPCHDAVSNQDTVLDKQAHLQSDELTQYCGKSFMTSQQLDFHSNVHTMQPNPTSFPYMCLVCDLRTKTLNSLLIHQDVHRMFECHCGQVFETKSELLTHKTAHEQQERDVTASSIGSADRLYHCESCNKSCRSQKSFTRHLQTARHRARHPASPPPPAVCRPEQSVTLSQSELDGRPEQNTALSQSEWDCRSEQSLNLSQSAWSPLEINAVREASNIMPVQCHVCDQTFDRKDELTEHNLVHMSVNQVKGNKSHGKKSQKLRVNDKNVHKMNHRTDRHKCKKSYSCKECGETFEAANELRAHRRIHSNNYACPYCNFKPTEKAKLKIHLRTHTGEKPYTCEYCAKAFAHKAYLKSHINIHTGEKPYECALCDYKANQRSSVNKHVKIVHENKREYACTLCPKRFSLKPNLTMHMKRHRGIKDVDCPLCDSKFVSKTDLNHHLKSHSEARPHLCSFCSDAFKRADTLRAHVRTQHRDQMHTLHSEPTLHTV